MDGGWSLEALKVCWTERRQSGEGGCAGGLETGVNDASQFYSHEYRNTAAESAIKQDEKGNFP